MKLRSIYQSSCNLSPTQPALIIFSSSTGELVLPLPVRPIFTGKVSVDCSIILISCGEGVHVVARVPVVGPVPPPMSLLQQESQRAGKSVQFQTSQNVSLNENAQLTSSRLNAELDQQAVDK